ncbi:guanine nucleotide-binding protein alpha-1 subunit [Polychytrium aggregatum]|uniref:guanine nucleotide-binding protein alpha-1 subunit n=1 Tax=Polychytrium aggregatum TaxID=110093 RepID=UPI0022FECE4D|nr:guanine nucleotide-binding protein alpha-1 subunit [Polychytrium aggregatum]KAI9199721.1 guanine nucleotide-binding protein alpha-1 subunit [Polychytrium aggregatum]
MALNCFAPNVDPEIREANRVARRASNQIDADLRKEAEEQMKLPMVKLLLLGAGESGKSTILKQFKIIHGEGFSDSDVALFKAAILGNTVGSMKILITEMERLEIPFGYADAKSHVSVIKEAPYVYSTSAGQEMISQEISTALKYLWSDSGVQACYARRNEYQIIDSCQYFMESIDRVCDTAFKPTPDDILRARIMTTTVTENKFNIGGIQYRIYDVGGQRNQRKKWIPYFDDARAIIYMAAVGSYDQVISEDRETNRMVEAIQLFQNLCDQALLSNTSFIIFLNKIDLLQEKIKRLPLKNYFPDYQGIDNWEEVLVYFGGKLKACNTSPTRKVYVYSTLATDTKQVTTVIKTVTKIVANLNLAQNGL